MISDNSARLEKLGISKNNGRILRTEPNAVGERVPHARFPRNPRHVVEIAFRVGMIQIQSGWDDACRYRKKNRADSCRSAGALRMANHRLRCAHWKATGAFAKAMLDGARLDAVVQDRRRAVQIHIIDIIDVQAAVLDGQRHCARGFDTRFVETHAMIGITRRPVAQNLGINESPAAAGGRFSLQNIDPRSLAEYKSLAVLRT